MGTIEKLFVQIFERKKWIEDQVKRQTLLFDQQLASKCLLDGIAPPPWLFSSPPDELNKEELISGLLLPCPPLAVPYFVNCYSIYNKPTVPADKGDLPDSFFTEVGTSYKGFDAGDRLSVSPQIPINDVEGASNGVQKGNSGAAISLPDQGVEKLSDVSPEPAQLLENFQRSKSRQRALALRNSAKLVGSNLREDNNAGSLAGGITGSEIATLQHDHVQELELIESTDISKVSCKVEETKLGEFQGKRNDTCVKEFNSPLILDPHLANFQSSCECVPYYKPAAISENEELLDASNKEVHTSSKGLVSEDGQSNLRQFTLNDAGFVSNGELEMDVGAESPQAQRSSGTSDIVPEPLQSLARVQRSKSRQRVLEVRNSAKAKKSCLSLENDLCVNSRVVTGSRITSPQSCQIFESELMKTANFDKESCKVVEAKVYDYQSKESSVNIYSGRSTRSQKSVQQPSSTREFSNVGSLSYAGRSSRYHNNEVCPESSKVQIEDSASLGVGFDFGMVCSSPQLKQRKVGGRLTDAVSAAPSLRDDDVVLSNEDIIPVDKMDNVEQLMTKGSKSSPIGTSSLEPGQIHESESVKTADFDNESCQVEGAEVYDFQSKEKSVNIYSGRITRSQGSVRKSSSMRESSHAGNLSYAERSSRTDSNVRCPEPSEQQIEENSATLGRGFGSVIVGSLPHFKQINIGAGPAGLTDLMPASLRLREVDAVQSNKDRSPVDRMDHVEWLLTKGSKPSPFGISFLEPDLIHESELVKTVDFNSESFEVEEAKVYDFWNMEESSNIYSVWIDGSRSSVQHPGSIRESSHPSSHAYAGRSSRDDNNVGCPESSEQQIEESSSSLESGFGSGMVGSSPQLKQRKVGGILTDAVSAAPSLRKDDVVQSNDDKSPVDKIDNVEQLMTEGSKSSPADKIDSVEQLVTEGSKSSPIGVSSLQPEPVYVLELCKPPDAFCESCGVKEANIGDIYSKENNISAGSERITRSQTPSSSSGDKVAGSSELTRKRGKKSIPPGYTFSHGAEDSWLQHKRRKVDHLCGYLSASPSLRGEGVAQSGVNKSPVVEMDQNEDCKMNQEFKSSHKVELDEEKPSSEERDKSAKFTPFTFVQESEMPLISSLINQKACSDAEAAVPNTTRVILDPDKQCAMGSNGVLFHLDNKFELGNTEHLDFAERGMHEGKCHLGGNDQSSQCSSGSPQRQAMELIDADQVIPEFEGFIMETDNGHSCTAGEGINLDKLDLLKTTVERASVLEQLCKSACMHTPLSHFPTPDKLHRAPNLYQSVPNGLLECIDLRINPSINDNIVKQLKASYSCFVEEANHSFQGRSYSDCLPFYSAQPASRVRKHFGSPTGKFWDSFKSDSASSEKRGSSNPELPSISEENENTYEVADEFQEGISSEVAPPVREIWDWTTSNSSSSEKRGSLNLELPLISEEDENTDMIAGVHQSISSQVMPSLVKREPLADITENPNLSASVSKADLFAARSSLDSVKTEFSFSGTCNGAKQKHGHHTSNNKKHTRQAKMSHGTSLGENGINSHRFLKPKLSGKPSSRKGGPSFTDRETKHNIVSNVTSFIPLVQRKQAAAIVTGKRDVKVKALEAADVAKRLAKEKENERKMKKETLKLERTKLEQENLKQLQLQKKKQEEERKKKEADMAARKRQREEDEERKKEQKRKRVVEARKQQQENEEKLRAKKEDKRRKKDADTLMGEKLSLMKVSKDETWRDNKKVKEQGEENLGKMLRTEFKATVVSTSEARETSIVLQVCEPSVDYGDKSKATSHLEKASENDQVTNQNQEPSYDISPYKDSDNEEEEDDDRPNTKFIPSWARKRASALLISSLQSVNPEAILPLRSSCRISEVLLPWRQQLNTKP